MKTRSDPAGDGRRSIGQLAEAAGVYIETVRYYHRRGLIPLPPKRAGGRRNYPDSALLQIVFIRRAQQLGFTLEEIGGLLRISDGSDCRTVGQVVQRKLDELGERVAMLNRMRRELGALLKRCEANDGTAPCPVIRAFDSEDSAR